MKLNLKKIFTFFILLYFTALSSFQLGYGIDPIIKKITFFGLIFCFILNRKEIKIGKVTICLLVFWLFYYFSILWASNSNDIFDYFNTSIYIIIISIVISNYIKTKDDIITLLKLIVISLFITTIILFIRTPINEIGYTRIGGALGLNPNDLGLRMAFGSLICVFLIHEFLDNKNDNKVKLIFLILFLITFLTVVVLTQSKKAIIIAILGIGLFELIRSKGAEFFYKIIIVTIGILISINLLLTNETLYSIAGYRIETFIQSLNGVSSSVTGDISTYERQFYINEGAKLFEENPIIGYGGNNFKSYMREIGYLHIAYSHNNYIEILSTLGIFGFIFYYYEWFMISLKLILERKKYTKKYLGLNYLLITIFLFKLFMDVAMISYINEFINILFVIGFCYVYNLKKKEDKEIYK